MICVSEKTNFTKEWYIASTYLRMTLKLILPNVLDNKSYFHVNIYTNPIEIKKNAQKRI